MGADVDGPLTRGEGAEQLFVAPIRSLLDGCGRQRLQLHLMLPVRVCVSKVGACQQTRSASVSTRDESALSSTVVGASASSSTSCCRTRECVSREKVPAEKECVSRERECQQRGESGVNPLSPQRLWAPELPTPPRAAERERCQQHRSVSANAQGESVSTRGGSACQQTRPSRRARVR